MEASSSTTTLTETIMDPSSLRALALSTLKSKRRRPAKQQPGMPLTSRPPPPNESLQLDYGQEDSVGDSVQEYSSKVPIGINAMRSYSADAQMREEGEISDEGETTMESPSVPSPKAATPTKTLPSRGFQVSATPMKQTDLKPSLLDRISSPPPNMNLNERTPIRGTPPCHDAPRISTEQVRPNVHLNQNEYDTAKDIILDLLGWGVPPEYLVDCGLTREIVYYIFTELNLRLPDNLDTAGLVPYTPDTLRKFEIMDSHQSPIRPRRSSINSSVPSSPESYSSGGKIKATNVPMTPPASTSQQGSLHDMERQRRQELIARKAVQASRKAKLSNAAAKGNKTIASNPSLPSKSSVPSEAVVEDFLKSIAPASDSKSLQSNATSAAMEIDGASSSRSSSDPPNQRSGSQSPRKQESVPPPTTASESSEPPPSSTDSMTTIFANVMQVSPERTSGNNNNSSVPHHPPRRGTKRPVASDFVDFDGHPRTNARSDNYDHVLRRKTGSASFVNIRPTKCVIDLSDSEFEDDEGRSLTQFRSSRSVPTKPDTKQFSPVPSSRTPTTGTSTPTTLEETEKEIQRIRDLIAQREQKSLLKKLGLKAMALNSNGQSSGSVTPMAVAETPSSASVWSGKTSASSAMLPPDTPLTESPPSAQPNNSTSYVDTVNNDDSKSNSPEPRLQVVETKAESESNFSDGNMDEIQIGEPVDVDDKVSSSAQRPGSTPTLSNQDGNQDIFATTEVSHENYLSYHSLFISYPSLRLGLSLSVGDGTSVPSKGCSTMTGESFCPSPSSPQHRLPLLPDLSPLRAAVIRKRLDPTKQICQYEIPGGGVCRDEDCGDLHLSGLNGTVPLEPNEYDTARYLCNNIDGLYFDSVLSALQGQQTKNPTLALEDRVTQALASLKPSSLSPPAT